MDKQTNSIVITDEIIISYYRENPQIDIVAINHIFIDILKNLSSNLSATINTTVNSKILSIVSDIDKNISLMKSDILLKLFETKREYIEDMKSILFNNISTTNDKISITIEKNTEHLLSKIKTTIDEIIPKSQDNYYLQIEGCIKNYFSILSQDTKNLLEIIKTNNNDTNVKHFIDNIDNHLTAMFSTIQQPIYNSLRSSEERTSNGIQQIKEHMVLQQSIQETLRTEMHDFLNKYKNSSQFKGNVAEIELQHMLLSIMPSDEIIRVSNDVATCDLKVNRKDSSKPSILFESKNYNRAVTTAEVKKFERDVQLQNIHGIFISHDSPITFKDNFQIDIINGLIHVYIPNANYQIDKVKIAIDIIDNLSFKLNSISKQNTSDLSINKEELDEITDEYRIFGIKKAQMLETIKSINKQLLEQLDEIQLPNTKKFLIRLGNIENDNNLMCTFCNNWTGKNKSSLAAHMRSCKFNSKNKDIDAHTILLNEPNLEENIVIDDKIDNVELNIPTIISDVTNKKTKNKISKKST
jgi:hypothetical protein